MVNKYLILKYADEFLYSYLNWQINRKCRLKKKTDKNNWLLKMNWEFDFWFGI